MPVKTWVGRFAIVDGQPQEESPLLRSFPRQRPDEEEDELYVLAEPASPTGEEHCGQLVDAIGRVYCQDTLSMTGAVLRALKAADHQLRDWNERSLREHRVEAGVSCLAVQGRRAYLSQVGPAVAYQVLDGRFSRVAPEGGPAEPLGRPEQAEPLFGRYDLSPGDLLLVTSPRIDEILDQQTLRSVLLKGADEALVELFRLARDQQKMSLVLLACVVEPETQDSPADAEAQPAAEPEEDEPPPAEAGLEADASAEVEEQAIAEPPEGLSQPKVHLKGEDADIRYPRTTGMRASLPRVPPLAIVAAVAVAAVGLLAWCIIPSALQESRDDQFTAMVVDARTNLGLAQETDDPGQLRALLEEADKKVTEAEDLRADDPEVAELREGVNAALAELNAVLELPELELIVDVSERVPGPFSSKDLALGGGGAYFLDREQERVIAISLLGPDPEPFVLFEEGELVGTEIGGAPRHIAWAEALNSVLILDDARRLIALTPPGQPRRLLAVRDADAWGSADGIATVDGSLYVLDAAGDQVWRYPPTESGFDSEREPLLAAFDLGQVVELSVGDALYLVLDDSILRVQGKVVQTLAQAGIDRPLQSPTSLVSLPVSGRLMVADHQESNDRIVVLSEDGTFRQQLVRSPTFSDLRAIAVDEEGGLLYMMVRGALYRTPLPPPGP